MTIDLPAPPRCCTLKAAWRQSLRRLPLPRQARRRFAKQARRRRVQGRHLYQWMAMRRARSAIRRADREGML